MATALTSLPGSHVTDGKPETVVSASLQKIKSIKTPIKNILFYLFIFYFINSETSDSFVSHFDGHFASLKALIRQTRMNICILPVSIVPHGLR